MILWVPWLAKSAAGGRSNHVLAAKGVERWTDNVSHGELIREGSDQTMTVDPDNLRFVFQGMLEEDKSGKGYGQFSWRIGMLTPVAGARGAQRTPAGGARKRPG